MPMSLVGTDRGRTTGVRADGRQRRGAGIIVLAGLLVLLIVVAAVRGRRLPGEPTAAPVPAAPRVGDCIQENPHDRGADLYPAKAPLASLRSGDCLAPRFGEVVSLAQGYRDGIDVPNAAIEQCFQQAYSYLGLPTATADGASHRTGGLGVVRPGRSRRPATRGRAGLVGVRGVPAHLRRCGFADHHRSLDAGCLEPAWRQPTLRPLPARYRQRPAAPADGRTRPSPTHPPVEPKPQFGVSHHRGEAAGPDVHGPKTRARRSFARWSSGPPPADRPAAHRGFRQPAQHDHQPSPGPAIRTGSTAHAKTRWVGDRRARSGIGLGSHPWAEVAPGFGPVFVATRDAVRVVAVPVGHPDRHSRAGPPDTRSATPPRQRRSRQPTSATTRPHLQIRVHHGPGHSLRARFTIGATFSGARSSN